MSLSHRVTENIEDWIRYKTATPRVELSDGTNQVGVMKVDGSYGLVTMTPGHISTSNSYSGDLESGESFTGVAEEIINFGVVSCIVSTNQDTATDGFKIEFSVDGATWIDGDSYTITADEVKVFSFQCAARYYRTILENGTDGTATIALQTILKPYYVKPSSHRINDIISPQDDAELMKSVLTAQNTSTNLFVPIKASLSNNLQVTDAENSLAIAKGEVTGSTVDRKFGNAFDFDTSDGEVTVWDGAEDGTAWEAMTYTFSTTAAIDSISSTDAGNTEEVTVEGLDGDYNAVIQTKALNGQNRVALDTSLLRVNRAYNTNGTLFSGHVFVYENDTLTGGVPDDASLIRAVIHPENQQTEMAVYTVPADVTAYMTGFYTSTAGSNKDSNYIMKFKTRDFGKVFRMKQKVSIQDGGTSYIPHLYSVPFKILPKTDIIMTAQMAAVGGSGASVSAGFELILIDD